MSGTKNSIHAGVEAVLIVEGTHEVDLITQLVADRGIDGAKLQLLPLGGKTKLQDNLRTLKLDPRFSELKAIGIVRDADSIISAGEQKQETSAAKLACQAVRGCLRNAGLPVPQGDSNWTAGALRVGIAILPDGVRDGMLETLCRESVQNSDGVSCVDGFFQCLKDKGVVEEVAAKAWTQAYVASKPEPDLPLGRAAKKGYWNLSHSTFDSLAQFISHLVATANAVETAEENWDGGQTCQQP